MAGPCPKAKDRLFFFYSFEDHNTLTPQALRTVMVPTELERAGDFSQSREANGNLIVVRDPTTGQPFPGNRIPADRINRNGQALLDVFPQPNQLDRNVTRGAYNYTFQESLDVPKRQHVFRVDYRPIDRRTSSTCAARRGCPTARATPCRPGTSNWGLLGLHYTVHRRQPARQLDAHPQLVDGERGLGRRAPAAKSPGRRSNDDELARRTRGAAGFTVGQFTPSINPLTSFRRRRSRGVPGTPAAITYDGRTPLTGADMVYTFNDTLTWTRGDHVFKAGFYLEHTRNQEGATATFGGNFIFSNDANNPRNTGYRLRERAARQLHAVHRVDVAARRRRHGQDLRVVRAGHVARRRAS